MNDEYRGLPFWKRLPPRPVTPREVAAALPDDPVGESMTVYARADTDRRETFDALIIESVGYRWVALEEDESAKDRGMYLIEDPPKEWRKVDSRTADEIDEVGEAAWEWGFGSVHYIADLADAREYLSEIEISVSEELDDRCYKTLDDDSRDTIRKNLYTERVKANAENAPEPLDEKIKQAKADAEAKLNPLTVDGGGAAVKPFGSIEFDECSVVLQDCTITAEHPHAEPMLALDFITDSDPRPIVPDPVGHVTVGVDWDEQAMIGGETSILQGYIEIEGTLKAVGQTIADSWTPEALGLLPDVVQQELGIDIDQSLRDTEHGRAVEGDLGVPALGSARDDDMLDATRLATAPYASFIEYGGESAKIPDRSLLDKPFKEQVKQMVESLKKNSNLSLE